MRKKTAFLLALAIMGSMTACQDKERGLPDESSMTQTEESGIVQTEENSVVQAEGMKETPSGYPFMRREVRNNKENPENIIEQDTVSDAGSQPEQEHVLIAYFSRWGNTDYPEDIDASTCDMCRAGQEQLCREVDGTNYIGFVCNGYNIVADTKGTLLWNSDDQYDKPHIILLSEQASTEYLSYLDGKNISYVVTGKNHIDLARAAEILKETFCIKRLGVVGGPAINTAFLDAGLLDEVIVLIGADIDGRASFPPVFNRSDNEKKESTPLELADVKKYSSGAVFIRYKTKRQI